MKKLFLLSLLLLVSLLICSCQRGEEQVPTTTPPPEPTTACTHEYDNGCDEICNLCGERRVDAHRWVQIGEKEGCIEKPTCQQGGLYLCMCRDCKKYGYSYRADNRTDHTFLGECAENCSICGASRIPNVAHSFDENNVCVVCGHTATVEECHHRFAFECSSTCKKCGFVRAATHAYHQDCSSDCIYCGETTRPEATHLDENADGVCDLCGLSLGASFP